MVIVIVLTGLLFFFNSIKFIKANQRAAIFRLGRLLRIAEPGAVFIIPIVDLSIVVDLDRIMPGWRGLQEAEIKMLVEYLVTKSPKIPEGRSPSDIRKDMEEEIEKKIHGDN